MPEVTTTPENIKLLVTHIVNRMTIKQKDEFIQEHLETDYERDELLFLADWDEEFENSDV